MGRGIGDFLEKDLCQHTVPPRTAALSAPDPVPGHCQPTPPLETPKTLIDKSDSVSFGVTAPFSWVLEHIWFCLFLPRVYFPSAVGVL